MRSIELSNFFLPSLCLFPFFIYSSNPDESFEGTIFFPLLPAHAPPNCYVLANHFISLMLNRFIYVSNDDSLDIRLSWTMIFIPLCLVHVFNMYSLPHDPLQLALILWNWSTNMYFLWIVNNFHLSWITNLVQASLYGNMTFVPQHPAKLTLSSRSIWCIALTTGVSSFMNSLLMATLSIELTPVESNDHCVCQAG